MLRLFIVSLIISLFFIASCSQCPFTGPDCHPDFYEATASQGNGVVYLGNIYCEKLGYQLETRNDESGGQRSVCLFPDGSECGTVAFFNGTCGSKYSFCEKRGHHLSARKSEISEMITEYAVCEFDDGTECLESEYIACNCRPGDCAQWNMEAGGCL
jgi:putative hemolysin